MNKNRRWLFVVLVLGATNAVPAWAGQWMARGDFSACPPALSNGHTSRADGPFDSEEACRAHLASISNYPCVRYSCKQGGGDSGDSGGGLIQDSTRNVVRGLMNGNAQQASTGMLGLTAGVLITEMQNAPAEAARRRAEEAAREAELRREAAERARKQDEIKGRLLGEARGGDSSSPSLMGVTKDPQLQLMSGNQALTAMASNAPAEAPAPAADGAKHSDAYSKGYRDASQCYSRSTGVYCSALAGQAWQACLDDYRAGYAAGDQLAQQILAQAMLAGRQAGAQGGKADAFADPRAGGGCRTQWVEAYNRGYFEGSHAPGRQR